MELSQLFFDSLAAVLYVLGVVESSFFIMTYTQVLSFKIINFD